MLRVNVGLSRKLSKDYNSTGYSVNIDGEVTAPVSDPEAVIVQVKELFDLAEEALGQQIERAGSESAIANRDAEPQREPPPQNNGRHAAENGNQAPRNGKTSTNGTQEEPATNKQVQYLLGLGKRQGLSTVDLEQKITETLGHQVGLYDLSKRDAAKVIDALTGQPANGRSYARR